MVKTTRVTVSLSLLLTLSGCASLWSAAEGPLTRHNRAPVFTAHDGQIHDPDARSFVARGINLQYGDDPKRARPAIAAIASVHADIIRLELRRNTTAWQVRRALDEAVRARIPVMLMYWESDITCGTDAGILKRDVHDLWLKRWQGVLREAKYQPYLMLNLANEWGKGDGDYADYLATYTGLIQDMRQAGLRMPLVIDAAECGQDTGSFLDGRGAQLQAADPLHNLIVSVHAYNKPWNSDALIDRHIADLKAEGVPFLIGEFGDRELVEDGNAVDHLHLMQQAEAEGVGWLAWSWKGNGGATKVLDMSRQYGTADLTRRGQDIVDGPGGLKAQ